MKQTINRLSELDILRGIAIFLVVFGHITHIAELRNYIWGFHIPIFFFISGLLFKPDKYNSFNDFLRNKIRNLIIPYIIFYLVTLCYYILIESHVRGGVSNLKLLLGMFYGSYYNNFMYFNGALCYCIGIIFIQNNITWLPWGLNAAFCGFIYYSCGFYIKNIFKYLKDKITIILFATIACTVLQVYLFPFPHTDLAACKIQDYILYIPISIIGIILYLCLSCLIKKNKIMEFLGTNSLVIFVFQEPVYRAVIFIFSKILKTNVEILRTNIFWCISMAIISILIIIPIIYAYNKWVNPQLKRIKL